MDNCQDNDFIMLSDDDLKENFICLFPKEWSWIRWFFLISSLICSFLMIYFAVQKKPRWSMLMSSFHLMFSFCFFDYPVNRRRQ